MPLRDKGRKRFSVALLLATLMVCAAFSPVYAQSVYCPLMDHHDDPIWDVYAGFVAKGSSAAFSSLRRVEFGLGTGLLFFHTGMGDFDLRARLDSKIFQGSGTVALPDHLAAMHVDFDYTLRLEDGYSLRLGVSPGFYSEINHVQGDHLFYPFRIQGIRALSSDVSALIGVDFYPGFDRWVQPRAGLRWTISDFMIWDLFYPRTEVVMRPGHHWAIRVGADMDHTSEYALKRKDDRKGIVLKETRLYVGVDRLMAGNVLFMIQAGRVLDRSIDFWKNAREEDVGNAYFVRIGLGGML